VIAEPTSNSRTPGVALEAGATLLESASWFRDHTPDVVVHLGAHPTSRSTQSAIEACGSRIVIDRDHLEPDPEGTATVRIREDPAGVFDELLATPAEPAPPGWRDAWTAADTIARRTLDRLLDSFDTPFEGRVARDLSGAIPHGGTLFVGNSMPIRDLDAFMAPRTGLRVLANRGASGIDGLVSTALGVAVAHQPTYALLGDLTFLYDVGALLWNGRRGIRAVLVVTNNGGGGIFDRLPQRALPEYERLFATPQDLDLGAICDAAGVGHARVTRGEDVVPAVTRAAADEGIDVVEVMSDRATTLERAGALHAAVDAALSR
jgi:2-succinyl-5-enolpyruvyl-6-hydroxy-3-cyclohexene-1-carboxylate synthase